MTLKDRDKLDTVLAAQAYGMMSAERAFNTIIDWRLWENEDAGVVSHARPR